MANSKYEYVKDYEPDDRCQFSNWLVVRLDGRGFHRFAETHHFTKPNDSRALNLMNRAAEAVMANNGDVKLAYGSSDKYSFILGRDTQLHNRRGMKITTNLCSLFTANYISHWSDFFPDCQLVYEPSFDGRIVVYPLDHIIQDYLCLGQTDCHINNLYNTTFWTLVQRGGLTLVEAEARLRGTESKDQNEILFSEFGINYNEEPAMYRKGTVLVREKAAVANQVEVASLKEAGGQQPPKGKSAKKKSKGRLAIAKLHVDVTRQEFWDAHPDILVSISRPLTSTATTNMAKSKLENVKKYERDDRCKPRHWLVVRLDGRGFHRFADTHHFTKPNDSRALDLMNRAADAVMADYGDVKLAYGNSDEYSFILDRNTQLDNRRGMKITTNICSLFTANYISHWSDFFPDCRLEYEPSFDGRIVEYATDRIMQDYMCWRQVDCHINNLFNTTFWTLVQRGGLTRAEAETRLRGTVSGDKKYILLKEFGINYKEEPALYRKGTVLVREKAAVANQTGWWWRWCWPLEAEAEAGGQQPSKGKPAKKKSKGRLTVAKLHVDVIKKKFWDAHPDILDA